MRPQALDAWLERLFLRFDAIPLWKAIPLLAAMALAASLSIAIVIALPFYLTGLDPRLPLGPRQVLRRGFAFAVLYAVVFMPLVETLLLQSFPAFIARHVTGRPWPIIAVMALSFATAHAVLSSPFHGAAMLGAGSVLAFAYFWASRMPPRPHPVLVTYAVHALNNLIVIASIALLA